MLKEIEEIEEFGLSSFTIGAHCEFHTLLDIEITSYDLALVFLADLAPLYSAAVKEETSIVNRPSEFAETAEMVEEDHLRDLSAAQCYNIVNTHIKSPSPEEVRAARRLHALMAPYKGLQYDEYNKKSKEIEGLLTALSLALPADMILLNLAAAIAQLQTHNDAFRALIAARTVDIGVRRPIATAETSELRRIADDLYFRIVKTVNSHFFVQPTADLEKLILATNSLITRYRLVGAHQGKHQKGTEEVVTEALRGDSSLREADSALRGADVFDDKL